MARKAEVKKKCVEIHTSFFVVLFLLSRLKRFLYEEAAADSRDLVKGKEFVDVRTVNSARGNELYLREGSGESLERLKSAVYVCGDEFYCGDAEFKRCHDLGGGYATGEVGDISLLTDGCNCGRKSGGPL